MTVTLRPTVESHIWELSDTMRLADVIEVGLAREGSPFQVLSESVACTKDAITAVDEEGLVIAIYGCSFGEGYAFPWMLSSPLVQHHGVEAVRLARAFVRSWLSEARAKNIPMLCNYVNRENHSARRFIQAMGFTIFQSPGPGPFDFFYQLCANPQPSC